MLMHVISEYKLEAAFAEACRRSILDILAGQKY